jgi:peptide/nickel transport system substrate-binding protein
MSNRLLEGCLEASRGGFQTRLYGLLAVVLLALALGLAACGTRAPAAQPDTVVFLIESMPTNLDPRIGTDAESQYLDSLLFSSLVQHDEKMNLVPDLAASWETPDPRTYMFHLRRDARFSNGEPVVAADVKYTFDSLLSGAVESTKRNAFTMVARVDAPDDQTVVFHLRQPFTPFLWDLSRPAVGIVPRPGTPGGAVNPAVDPIGSGPFRFVRAVQDEEVVLERNPYYFGPAPSIARVRFRIVPDATTRALELRKGSADLALNSLTPDMVVALSHAPGIAVEDDPGTHLTYIAFNLDDSILCHRRVRQALAYATDRAELIQYLLRGQARPALSLLPPNHWAYDPNLPRYDYDRARAERLLDAAGFPRRADGIRFHLTLKTSTDESARLLSAALQDEWGRVGVALELRPLEFGSFYSDITHGSFQLYTLRWVGANNDPDIYRYAFDSRDFPPAGANRGHYRNLRLDALLDQANATPSLDERRALYWQVQQIVAEDLPYITLWYSDNVCVHRTRIANIRLDPSGNYDFLARVVVR